MVMKALQSQAYFLLDISEMSGVDAYTAAHLLLPVLANRP
jgi:hypothetical protein